MVWLVAPRQEGPAKDAPWPDRRSLAWSGAAGWREEAWASLTGEPTALEAVAERGEGPAELSERAVDLAMADSGVMLLAAQPEEWHPFVGESCALRGATLAGAGAAESLAPAIRWLRGLVAAWATEMTAAVRWPVFRS